MNASDIARNISRIIPSSVTVLTDNAVFLDAVSPIDCVVERIGNNLGVSGWKMVPEDLSEESGDCSFAMSATIDARFAEYGAGVAFLFIVPGSADIDYLKQAVLDFYWELPCLIVIVREIALD